MSNFLLSFLHRTGKPLLIMTLSCGLSPLLPGQAPEAPQGQPTDFHLKAPNAKEVILRGQWSKEPIKLERDPQGMWNSPVLDVPSGVWEYSFVVDGLNVSDPTNPALKPMRQPTVSILHIPGTPPNPWDFQAVPHGTVHQHTYFSKVLGKERSLCVYTPPGYEADKERIYPLLVLQHGSGDNEQTWVAHGKAHWILDNLIAANKARPMVVLMIDGHPMGMVPRDSAEDKKAMAMESFRRELFEDALPLLESIYRVERDAKSRALAGLSMGGGQSLTVGLSNLDQFSWIGAFSAAPPSSALVDPVLADAAATNPKINLLWIAVGKEDFLREKNETFIAQIKKQNIKYDWFLTEGGHSWPVWRQYLADFLPRLFQKAQP
ncbi:MAG: hypothetical protein RL693_1753 [Verrucomicrobiota bacterium]|jgi:enterochelin esterase family protein